MEEKANLGLATTRELLAELTARIEVDGKLDYRTVDHQDDGAIAELPTSDVGVQADKLKLANKRVVRTKSSGDRVYCIDEDKKLRQWVTNPDVLKGLGFEASDVQEVDDNELLSYAMGPALYKVDQ